MRTERLRLRVLNFIGYTDDNIPVESEGAVTYVNDPVNGKTIKLNDGTGWVDAIGAGGPIPSFEINNIGTQLFGSGVMSNVRASVATVRQYDGTVVPVLANEIRIDGARRVDHSDGIMYNAGVLGIEYFDTESDGTTPISPVPLMLHEPSATNHFLNSSSPVTQAIALTNGTYTVWIDDTDSLGSVTLSGGATGSATAGSPLTFTNSGSVTFTLSGSNNLRVQVESGSYATSYIETAGSSVTRDSDAIRNSDFSNFNQLAGVLAFKFYPGHDSESTTHWPLVSGLDTNAGRILYNRTTANNIASFDGSGAPIEVVTAGWSAGDEILAAVVWSDAESLYSISVSVDGGSTWSAWDQDSYDGAFEAGTILSFFSTYPRLMRIGSCRLYDALTGPTLADSQVWVEANIT